MNDSIADTVETELVRLAGCSPSRGSASACAAT